MSWRTVKTQALLLVLLVALVLGQGKLLKAGSAEDLTGTSWRLVQIMSMDDTTFAPEDRSRYTLAFAADGSVQIVADCNSGTGSWKSGEPNALKFGQIAATMALCPSGSLHDRYLAQFPWVRSYVMRDGKLFLATMADGSIIEFEPVELPVAATVLGEEIRTSDAAEMRDSILSRLFDHYAEEHRIEVSAEEIETYADNMQRGMSAMGLTAEKELTEAEAAQLEEMRRQMGRSMIRQWKLNRALYSEYGGRIIYQQLGPEPLDAYREYLEERRDSGDFTIYQKELKDEFWRYFTSDSLHDFFEPGSKEEAAAFSTPPWERIAANTEKGEPSTGQVVASAEDGGPLNWQVSGVTGGLNLRAEPSTLAEILATYAEGTILDNLGCQQFDDRIWCDVQQFGGGPRGYVAAAYLTAAISPNGTAIMGPDDSALRAGRGEFDATGPIPCAQHSGQPMGSCEFGVALKGGGYATVVITKPDGTKRAVFFRMGVAVGADTSQADGYPEFKATKENDLHLIRVGDERYEIPDAVILGG